jgi:regulator of sigma E protease
VYQLNAPDLDIKVKRNNETIELSLKGRPDPNWPVEDRGLILQAESQVQQAKDVGDAIHLGGLRTVRFIKTVYMNLYAMVIGRVSAKTMSGPLTIANVSYKLAGEDFWQFLLFLGMISVNLAVVNFLPIPVLDGGHMVFLILEKILGRPVPERVFAFAMYTGLFLILSLMLFVVVLDVRRLFFGWF